MYVSGHRSIYLAQIMRKWGSNTVYGLLKFLLIIIKYDQVKIQMDKTHRKYPSKNHE